MSDQQTLLALAANGARICDDSREASHGCIFIAVDGAKGNGGEYIGEAIAKGARYVACSGENAKLYGPRFPQCQFVEWRDSRDAAWQLACAAFHAAQNPVKVIGVTGTNGKTTSANLLDYLLQKAGFSTGVLGTINYRWPGFLKAAPLTTPGPLQLHEMLEKMSKVHVDYAIMEVSSHALAQLRVGGVNFSGALFCNLTQDHLDFHKDMENYFQAKARLFLELPYMDKATAVNVDDQYGARLAALSPNGGTYGFNAAKKSEKHLHGEILESGIRGLRLKMSYQGRDWELKSPLVGTFNAYNLLGVQCLALQLGLKEENFYCLEEFHGVCGRLEKIPNDRKLNIFVDYAHTPDALINVQKALREAGFDRLLVVFGCGGNRDRAKRPLMGEAVAQYADIAILTSDNPRFEDAMAIINDVKPGLKNAAKTIIEPDRKKATKLAFHMLGEHDALLIAGKGHEDYQIINGQKTHYSDQEVIRELLRCE